MEDVKKEILCRLCLNDINGENYKEIDDNTKETLNFILLKLTYEDKKDLMCSACADTLCAAFNFKCTCFYTDDVIFSHKCEEELPLDLREIFLSENVNENLTFLSDDQKVCRLCMHLINNDEFEPACEVDDSIFQTYIPEINLNISRDPVICKLCLNSVNIHGNFIKNCLELDSRVNMTKQETDTSSVDIHIKTEETDIKCEEPDSLVDSLKIQWYNCNLCDFKSVQEYNLKQHVMKHKNSSEGKRHVCNVCSYQSDNLNSIKMHTLMHNDPSYISWYKCEKCDYKSKYKNSMKVHIMLKHQAVSELTMHKCDKCDYQAELPNQLKRHELVHKDPSEIQWYKCDVCDYKSKRKCHLESHTLGHKNPSEVEWYKCDACNYKTIRKRCLKNHVMVRHMDSSVQRYKCDICTYQTTVFHSLKTHMIVHKDSSEIEWHKCDKCEYKTKYKTALKTHSFIHNDSPELLKIYHCDKCDYQVNRPDRMRAHKLTHRDISEIPWYKCDLCYFRSRRNIALKKHIENSCPSRKGKKNIFSKI